MTPRLLLALAFAAGLGLTTPACSRTGAQVQTGIDLYERGAYEGALVRFERVAGEERELRAKQRVRYLVYRGLSHWHLDQDEEARTHLADAQRELAREGVDAKWLPADVREELARALEALGLAGTPVREVPLPGPSATQAQPPPGPPPAAPPGAPPAPPAAAPPPGAPPPGAPGAPPPAPPPTVGPPPGPGAPPAPPPGPGGPPPTPIPPAASPPPAEPL